MHFTEADIVLFLEKKLTGEERARFETHFAQCPECVSQLSVIARLKREMPGVAAPKIPKEAVRQAEHIVNGKKSKERMWWWLFVPRFQFAFGGLALLAAGLVVLFLPNRTEVLRYRDSTNFSSTQLLAPVDGTNVEPQTAFRWRAAQEAIAYRFTLHDNVGLITWEIVSSETTITLPSQLSLKPGEHYFWRVESLFPDQSSQRSELNAFTFSP